MTVGEEVRRAVLESVARLDMGQVDAAAPALAARIAAGGLLHVLGSGHSQLLALEGFYRAGGPAWVVPLLDDRLSPAHGVSAGAAERRPGLGARLVFGLDGGQALLIVSNSGRNPVPVEAAEGAVRAGLLTLAITSRSDGNRLATIVDHVLDTGVPPGDAAVSIGDARMAPLSTILGAVMLHALLAQTTALLGGEVLVSNNVPGGRERNAALVARYPHLRG